MQILWAPWRMTYILKARESTACFFCEASKSINDYEHKVIYRSKFSIALLNIYPYNTAHVMIAPKRHVPRPDLLTDDEALDLHKTLNLVINAIEAEYHPQGFNIGMNIGKVAGAGVEGHMHVHIVPRWLGDSNYMPVVGGTKIIPEDIEKTYKRLKASVEKIRISLQH